MRISEFAEAIGKSAVTVRRWEEQGRIVPVYSETGQRLFTQDHINQCLGLSDPTVIAYCRTASHRDHEAYACQHQSFDDWEATHSKIDERISEVGSGLLYNADYVPDGDLTTFDNRHEFMEIIDRSLGGEPIILVVSDPGRIGLFGIDLVRRIMIAGGGDLTYSEERRRTRNERRFPADRPFINDFEGDRRRFGRLFADFKPRNSSIDFDEEEDGLF